MADGVSLAENEIEAPPALLDGIEAAVAAALSISNVRHRSALLALGERDPVPGGTVAALFAAVAANWDRCEGAGVRARSSENWRWRKPQLALGPGNPSREVGLERTLIQACERAGRDDWSNQVPVASGLAGSERERRRAIDLVHQVGPSHFELIELKVASDTPLYAAVEIIGYVCIWLLSRAAGVTSSSSLLCADHIGARVLAPAAYYARYRLAALQRALNEEIATLGKAQGVTLDFRFEAFPDAFAIPPLSNDNMLALLAERRSL
jgi:hypothetical protein